MSGRRRLEYGGHDARSTGEIVHGWVAEVEYDDQEHIDEVQGEDDAEEDPGGLAAE